MSAFILYWAAQVASEIRSAIQTRGAGGDGRSNSSRIVPWAGNVCGFSALAFRGELA